MNFLWWLSISSFLFFESSFLFTWYFQQKFRIEEEISSLRFFKIIFCYVHSFKSYPALISLIFSVCITCIEAYTVIFLGSWFKKLIILFYFDYLFVLSKYRTWLDTILAYTPLSAKLYFKGSCWYPPTKFSLSLR